MTDPTCTPGYIKCSTNEDQRYHNEIYLGNNMLYKDKMIENTV